MTCVAYKAICACFIDTSYCSLYSFARLSVLTSFGEHREHRTDGVWTNEIFFYSFRSIDDRLFLSSQVGVTSQLYYVFKSLLLNVHNSTGDRGRPTNQEQQNLILKHTLLIWSKIHAHFSHLMSLFIYMRRMEIRCAPPFGWHAFVWTHLTFKNAMNWLIKSVNVPIRNIEFWMWGNCSNFHR